MFTPECRKRTFGALLLAVVALITWWSCNAFISVFTTALAQKEAVVRNLDKLGTVGLVETWKLTANAAFNVGGLIGTLVTIPVSKHLGRKAMFAIYFVASAAALLAAFGIRWAPEQQLLMYFPIGLSVFGVFGAFRDPPPELPEAPRNSPKVPQSSCTRWFAAFATSKGQGHLLRDLLGS